MQKTFRFPFGFLFISLLLLAAVTKGQTPIKKQPVKIGLVLSGGGAQGLAHIGVLKAFEEYQIPIDLIVGSSAGALVGGLYASGISVEQLESMAKDGTIMELFLGRNELSDVPVWQRNDKSYGKFSIRRSDGIVSGPPGLLNDQLIWRDLFLLTAPANHLAHSNFDSLLIPFRAIGANVVSQKSVIFNSGSLAEAMRASMSIPMVYPAVMKDGAILVDGGIYNNMPTDIAQGLGADYIIAVNVDDVPPSIENLTDVFDFFDFFSGVLFSFSDSSSVSGWDYFVNVDTKGFNLFDFAGGEALIERGYEAGSKAGKNINETIHRRRDINHIKNRQHEFQTALNDITIDRIQWINKESGKTIKADYKIDTPFAYSSYKIRSIINALYATNKYNLIIPELSDNGSVLKLIVRYKIKMQIIPEVKISSVDGFNLSGDWDYRFADNQYSMRSKVSLGNTKGSVDVTLSPNKFISPYAVHSSRMLWKLNVLGNYQVLQNVNSSKDIFLIMSGLGLSTNYLLSWNQQIVTTANIHASYWKNLKNTLSLDYRGTIYPVLSLRYENNHIRRYTPLSEGWLVNTSFISGLWDSNIFYSFQGQAKFGLPLKRKYHIGMDFFCRVTSEPAPLEMTAMTVLPTAFTTSHYVNNLAYSSYNISFDVSRTIFRDDLFLMIRSFNSYLENRIFNLGDGWTSGGDISIKYNSILGPLELGWSILDDNGYQIVSWTKLHIYL